MGNESKEYVCDVLSNAKIIEVEFDKNSKKQDKFDRYLAWIWVDNKLLQEQLISEGLAKVDYVYDEYKSIYPLGDKEDELRKALKSTLCDYTLPQKALKNWMEEWKTWSTKED